jgi:hypothetical protein
MPRLLLVVMGTVLLAGCVTTTWTAHQAQQRTVVADPVEVAYAKASHAVMTMGGTLGSLDPAKRLVSGRLNKAVVLQVALTPTTQGTQLDVHATADTGYILAHDVPEDVQAFLAAYAKE